ncbi:MAG: secretin N-terminal domain-containing protein [Phycisphaerae bacterium]
MTMHSLRISTTLLITLAIATGSLLAQGPATQPSSATSKDDIVRVEAEEEAQTAPAENNAEAKPATQPVDDSGEKQPAGTDQAGQEAQPEKNFMLQFKGIPANDVIRLFAQKAGRPLISQPNVPGSVVFFDSEPYTYEEALDTINKILAARGYLLMEDGKYFNVVPVASVQRMPIKIFRGMDNTDEVRKGKVVTVLMPLKYIDPTAARSAVSGIISAYGRISPLIKGKGLIITDHMENIRRAGELLKELDKEDLAQQKIKTHPLKHAAANDVANIINKLFAGSKKSNYRYDPQQRRYVSASTTGPDFVQAMADTRTNSIILVGSGDRISLAEEMIRKLDEETPGGDNIRIFVVKKAKAEDVAKNINETLGGTQVRIVRGRPVRTTNDSFNISVDAANNRLVVSAQADMMTKIEKLVKELDTESVATTGGEIFEIEHGNAPELQNVIRAAMATKDSRGRTIVPVSVSAEPRNNLLIVSGSSADLRTVSKLIQRIDKPRDEEAREIHVVQLQAGDARTVARSLVNIFSRQVPAGRRSRSVSNLKVEAEQQTNCLIISSLPADWPMVQSILTDLKAAAGPGHDVFTRSVPLKFAKAEEIARTLATVFNPRARGRSRPGNVITPVVVSPNKRTNSLVVSASQADHDAIASLLDSLDVEATEKIDPINIVTLESADAVKTAERLAAMLPRPARGQQPEITIQPDPITNSLLIRAPESKREMINKLIAKVDEKTKQSAREMRVIKLENASAASLEDMLSQLYGGATSPRRPGRGSVDTSETAVKITAAPDDKTLIIEAPREQVEEIIGLVKGLDAADGPGSVQIRTYAMANSQAADVARSLARLFAQQRGSKANPNKIQPRFEADTSTNRVMVAAAASQFEEIEKLVKKLNESAAAASQTKTYKLKHAKAEEIAPILEMMLSESGSSSQRARRGRGPSSGDVRVAAITATNSITVQSTSTKIALADELIQTYDTAEAGKQSGVHIISLENAQAETLAASLQAMLPPARRGRPQEVYVHADTLTNSVLLRAPEAQRKMLEEMVAKLDQATIDQARETRIIRLKHASAQALTGVLGQLYTGSVTSSRRGRGRQPAGSDVEKVVISAAPNDKALVVDAPKNKIEEISQLVSTLDTKEATGELQVRTYTLAEGDVNNVARSLTNLFRKGRSRTPDAQTPEPRFQADPSSDQLMVAATAAQFEEIEPLIEKIKSAKLATETRTFKLEFAKAAEIVGILQSMLLETGGGRRRGTPTGPVRVAALDSANAVIVQAPSEKLILAEQLIRQFDNKESGGAATLKVVQLTNADANTLAQAVGAAMGARSRRRGGTETAVSVTAETNSNSVLVRGPAAEVAEAVDMIKGLDKQSDSSQAQYHVIPLKNAEASEVAKTVATLFRDIQRQRGRNRRGQQAAPFSAVADPRTNSVIISATQADFALVNDLLANLDKAPDRPDRDVQYVWLENADAFEMAEKLSAMYSDRRGPDKPVIEPDTFANAITIIAKEEDLQQMEPIIAKLDKAAKDTSVQVRVVSVSQVRAERMAEIIKRVYSQMSDNKVRILDKLPEKKVNVQPGEDAPKMFPAPEPSNDEINADDEEKLNGRPSKAEKSEEGKQKADADAEADAEPVAGEGDKSVSIAVDKSTNTLIISGSKRNLDEIESLIAQLTTSDAEAESEFRIFKVEQADVTTLAETLDKLFNPQKRLPQPKGKKGQPAPVVKPSVIFVPESRTRSLIVRAKPLEFDMIEQLLGQLDKVPTVVSEIRIFALKNTDAEEVSANLNEIFRLASAPAQQPKGKGKQGTPQQQRAATARRMLQLKGEDGSTQVDPSMTVNISANNQTNSVIVSAPSDAMALVAGIISELDQSVAPSNMPVVRLYPVQDADVQATVSALQEIFKAGQAARGRAGQPSDAQEPITITADVAGKVIIVSAPEKKHELIAKVINDIDKAQGGDKFIVRVYRIEFADAAGVASALTSTMTGSSGRRGQPSAGLRISADRSSNSIVIRGSAAEHEEVASLIEKMDLAPAEQFPVRVITLANADASTVANLLNRMINQTNRQGRRGGTGSARAIIEADPASRMVLVRANDETFEKIRRIATQLDESSPSDMDQHILDLANAKAENIAGVLQQAFPQRRGRGVDPNENVTIIAEAVSNSLIVTANETNLKKVKTLLAKLDTKEATDVRTEMLKLEHAKATELVDVLKSLSGEDTSLPWWARRRGEAESKQKLTITAEGSSNTLIIRGQSVEVDKILAMARKLDLAAQQAVAVVKMYPVKNADVPTVVSTLEQIFTDGAGSRRRQWWQRGSDSSQARTVILGDQQASKIVVSAQADKHKDIAEMIAKLDEAASADEVLVRVYKIRYADAAGMAQALNQTINKAAARGRGPAEGAKIRIAADRGSNALIVRGTKKDQSEVAKLVAEMDMPATAQYPVRSIQLTTADADTLAATLNRIFNEAAAGRGRRGQQSGGVLIEGDTDSHMLLVRADDETYEKIKTLAAQLDSSSPEGKATQSLVQLKHADAESVAVTLSQAFRPVRGRRLKPDEQVTIVAEDASNSLVITANKQNLKKVKDLLATIDTEDAGGKRTEYVVLEHAQAEQMVSTLQQMAGGTVSRGRRRGGTSGANQVVISAETSSNAIVMTGPSGEIDRIMELAVKLDTAAKEKTTAVVKTYPVRNIDITTVVGALQQMFDAQAVSTRSRFRRGSPAQTPIVIFGDEAAGKVVVSAPAEKQEAIARVLTDLDQVESGEEVVVKVYKLENAEANSAAFALQNSLTGQASRRGGTGGGLRISADRSSNSIVVRASQEEQERIAGLIEQIDAKPSEKYPVHIITMKNADVTEVAQTLSRIFGVATARGRRGGANTQGVVIESDSTSKTLVVRADEDTYKKIAVLAASLDEAPAGKTTRELIPLKFAKASSVAPALTRAFAPARGRRQRPEEAVTIIEEEMSNSLIVTANTENLQKVRALVRRLDSEDVGGVQTELLVLQAARATEVAETLEKIAGQSGRGRRGASDEGVKVSADAASNAVLISGPKTDVENFVAMAKQLDASTETDGSQVYVVKLENGVASEVASTVQSLYQQTVSAARREKRTVDPMAVSYDERANALVLATSKRMYDQVSQWVGEVEKMKPAQGTLRIIQLENVDPADVQKAIDQLYGGGANDRVSNRRGGNSGGAVKSGTVESTVLSEQKSILVNASEEDFESILKLAKALDEAAAKAKRITRVFPLKNATNTRVAAALTTLYPTRGVAERDQVTVTALAQTKAVVVAASKEKMEDVAHLISELDKKEVSPQLEYRVYALEHAQPGKLLPVLQKMLAQIKNVRPDETIDVQADERTRSIIVTARGTVFDQVDKLIRVLDQAAPQELAEAQMLILPLKAADAPGLARVLREMLRPTSDNEVTPDARALQEQIKRLRVRSAVAEKIPELDLSKPIKIASDPEQKGQPGSNSLIVASTTENLKAMASIVEVLDTVPITEGAVVRLIHLSNADAQSVMNILKDVFTQGERLAGKKGTSTEGKAEPETTAGKALVHPLNVSADLRTNSLVVSGLMESVALAEGIVRDLDREKGEITTEVKLFKLEHAPAAQAAGMLSQVFAEATPQEGTEGLRTQVTRLRTAMKGKLPKTTTRPKTREALVIQADEAASILVVAARSDVMPLIADVVKAIDIPRPGTMDTVRFYPLDHADAGTVRQMLGNLYENANQELLRAEDKPNITIDTRTNTLIVSTSDKTFKVIESLLKRVDVEMKDPSVRLEVIPLQHNDATAVAPMIERIFADRLKSMAPEGTTPAPQNVVNVEADPLANALVVSANKQNMILLRDLLTKVDLEPSEQTAQVKLFHLTLADATRISEVLKNLISQGLYKPGAAAAQDNPLVAAREKISVAVDTRTNVLIVSASPQNLKLIGGLIDQLDSSEDYSEFGDIRTYELKRADATKLAPTLEGFFQSKRQAEMTAGSSGRSLPLTIIPDARTNTLLVAGSRESFAAIERMIKKLDGEQIVAASTFKVFPLEQATAAVLQPTLQQLFDQRVTRGQTKDAVTVIADTRSNSLLVGASPEDMKLAGEIIEKLDTAPGNAESVKVFALKKADAAGVAEVIRSFYEAQQGTGGVTVSVDERVNAVVVSAGKADMARIEKLVAKLDTKDVTSVAEIRVFTLENAKAPELAQILTDTLTSKPASPTETSANRQMLLQFITRSKGGEELITSALQQGVLITPDPRTNSLVISAPVESMPLLDSLIRALDSTAPKMAEIRVFALQNAQASRMAEVLTSLFALESTGGNDTRAVRYTLTSTQPAKAVGPAATVGTDEQKALTVTVDSRTNSLLIGGTEQYVAMCSKIIEELDSSPAQERINKVYHPRNAQAADIQTALRSFLDQELTRLRTTLGEDRMGAAQRLLEREVAVVAEPVGNTLLISASPRYFQTIERMMLQLDKAPPQVLIRVLLAEIALDDTTDLGLDWNYTTTSGDKTVETGTNFGVNATASSNGGFSMSVTGGDLNLFLHALQSQGRLEVLSRPQILAIDNKESRINIGQRVPFIRESRVTDQGTTLNTIQYEPIGINLTVTPRINDDGFVKMDVAPEISSLSESNVQVSENVNAVVINSRSAETTVNVKDGQTIVIGGLITTRDEDRESKVPVLGDLYLIGNLFRQTRRIKERTELLIILTPEIIRTPEDARRMSARQINRLNLKREESRKAMLNPTMEVIDNASPRQRQILRSSWEEVVPNGGEEGSAEPFPLDQEWKIGGGKMRQVPPERNNTPERQNNTPKENEESKPAAKGKE